MTSKSSHAQEITERIAALHALDYSFTDVAEFLTIEYPDQFWSKDKVQKIDRERRKLNRLATEPKSVSTREKVDEIRAWLGTSLKEADIPFASEPTEYRRIAVVADLHSNPDLKLTNMLVESCPDIIVLGGDLLDSKQISRHAYNPAEKPVSLQDEIRLMRAWVEQLALRTTAEIWILKGNHDAWAERNISELIPHEIMFLVKSPLDLIAAGIDRVHMVSQPVSARLPNGMAVHLGETQYMMLVGDAVVSHANFTGKNPGASSLKLYEYIKNFRRYLGWPEMALGIQTHTHKLSLNEYEGGWFVAVEPGIGGTPLTDAYKANGYEAKWSASPIGAVVFSQELVDDEWKTIRSTIDLLRPYR